MITINALFVRLYTGCPDYNISHILIKMLSDNQCQIIQHSNTLYEHYIFTNLTGKADIQDIRNVVYKMNCIVLECMLA